MPDVLLTDGAGEEQGGLGLHDARRADQAVTATAAEPADYLAWFKHQSALAFSRIADRRALRKRRCDCGHWIDGSEPYRYQVWKQNGDETISQRTDCEACARADLRG